jgi:hypothetical protein
VRGRENIKVKKAKVPIPSLILVFLLAIWYIREVYKPGERRRPKKAKNCPRVLITPFP